MNEGRRPKANLYSPPSSQLYKQPPQLLPNALAYSLASSRLTFRPEWTTLFRISFAFLYPAHKTIAFADSNVGHVTLHFHNDLDAFEIGGYFPSSYVSTDPTYQSFAMLSNKQSIHRYGSYCRIGRSHPFPQRSILFQWNQFRHHSVMQ